MSALVQRKGKGDDFVYYRILQLIPCQGNVYAVFCDREDDKNKDILSFVKVRAWALVVTELRDVDTGKRIKSQYEDNGCDLYEVKPMCVLYGENDLILVSEEYYVNYIGLIGEEDLTNSDVLNYFIETGKEVVKKKM